jgi:hypothetical protein
MPRPRSWLVQDRYQTMDAHLQEICTPSTKSVGPIVSHGQQHADNQTRYGWGSTATENGAMARHATMRWANLRSHGLGILLVMAVGSQSATGRMIRAKIDVTAQSQHSHDMIYGRDMKHKIVATEIPW